MRTKLAAVVALLITTSALVVAPAEADPVEVGRWSAPFWEGGALAYDPPSEETSAMFPAAVSIVALPDGRILYWNGLEGSEDGDAWAGKMDGTLAIYNSRARILDLRGDAPTWTIPTMERGLTDEARDQGTDSTKDMFCADLKQLYDGTVLIAGGSEWRGNYLQDPTTFDGYGDDEARVFDPDTDTFTPVDQMSEPRWYPSMVTLADGRVLITSGLRRVVGSFTYPDTSFSQVRLNEIYDPSTEAWTDAGTHDFSLPLYPRIHLLPDGKVFYASAGQTWAQFGETPDMATWGEQRVYDPATQTWTAVGQSTYGVRSGATSTLLRLEPPYDEASILVAGGTLGPTPGSWIGTTLSEVIRWTPDGITNQSPALPIDGLTGDPSQLRAQRWFGSSVMLPTGEVLLVNGNELDDVVIPGAGSGVRTAELYDPETNTWRAVATAARDRGYHNTALLLPDGRVLIGGNAPHQAYYTQHTNPAARSNNYRDPTFEIYEPPYLHRGDRPIVSAVAPTQDGRALTLTLGEATDAGDITEVVLVRLGAATHTVDADMRAVVLEHSTDGAAVIAALPDGGDGSVLPPGAYYVFAMHDTAEGPVPSIGRTVLVQPDAVNGGVVIATP